MAFTFIDLFAGIGGLRIPFDNLGGSCVFSSDIDKFACQTYKENFDEVPHGDITKIDISDMPKYDVLLAVFPCQLFSNAGVSKKKSLERNHGFATCVQKYPLYIGVYLLRPVALHNGDMIRS